MFPQVSRLSLCASFISSSASTTLPGDFPNSRIWLILRFLNQVSVLDFVFHVRQPTQIQLTLIGNIDSTCSTHHTYETDLHWCSMRWLSSIVDKLFYPHCNAAEFHHHHFLHIRESSFRFLLRGRDCTGMYDVGTFFCTGGGDRSRGGLIGSVLNAETTGADVRWRNFLLYRRRRVTRWTYKE